MKNIIYAFFVLVLTDTTFFEARLYAQAPAIQWQKSFGGSQNDIPSSVQETYDSGYIVAGISSSNDGDVTLNHGDYDCWIVVSNGKSLWVAPPGMKQILFSKH